MQTILITGTSSGYGLETARHFLDKGWTVVATMRRPDPGLFPASPRLRLLPLDVTNDENIADTVAAAGPIEGVVKNGGIGVVGGFEGKVMAHVRKIFATNTFGVMAMCQAIIPQMRDRRSGVIVNVTSSVTLAAMPLAAAYTASKQAIEGFTGSLAHELEYFNVRAKLIAPGYAPTTRFAQNTDLRIEDLIPPAYAGFATPFFAEFAHPAMTTKETEVAEAIWTAVHDSSDRVHFPGGADAVALYEARYR